MVDKVSQVVDDQEWGEALSDGESELKLSQEELEGRE